MKTDEVTTEIIDNQTGESTGPLTSKEFRKRGGPAERIMRKIITRSLKGDIMIQPTLIKISEAESQKMRLRLADLTIEYIGLENEKRASDDDFNGRLKELWGEIVAIQAALRENAWELP